LKPRPFKTFYKRHFSACCEALAEKLAFSKRLSLGAKEKPGLLRGRISG
jgi:hypothetical protein